MNNFLLKGIDNTPTIGREGGLFCMPFGNRISFELELCLYAFKAINSAAALSDKFGLLADTLVKRLEALLDLTAAL